MFKTDFKHLFLIKKASVSVFTGTEAFFQLLRYHPVWRRAQTRACTHSAHISPSLAGEICSLGNGGRVRQVLLSGHAAFLPALVSPFSITLCYCSSTTGSSLRARPARSKWPYLLFLLIVFSALQAQPSISPEGPAGDLLL